jgi:aspartyl-tRNA(Asn)/glutamyl-tRNA(Gln) amidotransferase subunit A
MPTLHYLSLHELQDRLRTGEISPIEVLDGCLDRIEALNPRLNAFALVLHDRARAQALEAGDEIRNGRWRGPLHGVPIAVKDFYDTANIRTTAAFEGFRSRVPKADAVAVARLQAAGAIVVGKTNMHTLGMGTTGLVSFFGPVRNPWNEAYIPGGSSSGSAAAVAAGLCYATLDTDAIGSCRLPAACCGVVGFKGTYGLISTKGILEGEQADEAIVRLSHAGITTRSAADIPHVLRVLAEPNDARTPAPTGARRSQDGGLRIGVATNATADREVTRAFGAAVDTIEKLGHQRVAATAPFDIPAVGDLRTIEADRRTAAARVFKDIDVLLLPTTRTTVPSVLSAGQNPQALSPANTAFANYFGLPAISVPCGFDDRGLPTGLQIVGPPGEEATILRLARQFETARGGAPERHPLP